MARDEAPMPDVGVSPVRRPRKETREERAGRIAARVARFETAPATPNVTPLNPGFFHLERMKAGVGAKERGKIRERLTGR